MQGFFRRCMEAQGYILRSSATSSSTSVEPLNGQLPQNDAECLVHYGIKCPDWVKKANGS